MSRQLPPLIRNVVYDAETKALTVIFQVGSYTYRDVPQEKAVAMGVEHQADPYSTRYFDANIEGKYKSQATA